jgi:phosphatidylglycerol:prolipoprotein diacylglycerol transferase
MSPVFAAIPYTTFPTIELGPLSLRTFGLFVALGVLVGAWLAAGYAERFGVERDETYRVATWMVLAGIIGARLTWAATHTDQIENPVDVIAIWEGGIQFSGGFIAALIVGLPFFKRWARLTRWHVLDGYAYGLAAGLAFGRVGCYSVGEHFGNATDVLLGSRYDGGEVREPFLGDAPLTVGTTFHNTALYEFLYLLVLFGAMSLLLWRARRAGRELPTGTLVGLFVLVYGVCRFLSDALRVNDERVAGLTGAQWMSVIMVPAGIFILWKVRPRLALLADAPAEPATTDEAEMADEAETADGATAEADEGDEAAEVTDAEDDATAEDAPDDVDTPTTAEVEADEVAEPEAAEPEPEAGAAEEEPEPADDEAASTPVRKV